MKERKNAATLARRIRDLLADGKPRAATEVADELGADSTKVREHLRRAAIRDEHQKVHTVDRLGPRLALRYAIGASENTAVRPYGKAHRENMTEVELNEAYRSRGERWPVADVLVIQSFDNMVRQGART